MFGLLSSEQISYPLKEDWKVPPTSDFQNIKVSKWRGFWVADAEYRIRFLIRPQLRFQRFWVHCEMGEIGFLFIERRIEKGELGVLGHWSRIFHQILIRILVLFSAENFEFWYTSVGRISNLVRCLKSADKNLHLWLFWVFESKSLLSISKI